MIGGDLFDYISPWEEIPSSPPQPACGHPDALGGGPALHRFLVQHMLSQISRAPSRHSTEAMVVVVGGG